MSAGYLYVLINSSMPGLTKVGHTSRDPRTRVDELSSATGVATPFTLAYYEFFENAMAAESFVHALLERQGRRVSENREFFQAELTEVIRTVAAAPGKLDAPPLVHASSCESNFDSFEDNDELAEFRLDGYRPRSAADEVYEEADAHYYGIGEVIQDYSEAFRLYKQAARLGSADAQLMLGEMYEAGEGVRENLDQSLKCYKEAARLGNFLALGKMARLFNGRHPENEAKLWGLFFQKLSENPTAKFNAGWVHFIIIDFLFARTVPDGMFGRINVKLDRDEENFVAAMRPYKDEVLSFVSGRLNERKSSLFKSPFENSV